MSYVTIGVDCGLKGGIACLVGNTLHTVKAMPVNTVRIAGKWRKRIDLDGLRDIFDEYATHCPPATTPVVAIEHQQARQGEGTVSSFTNGYGFAAVTCLPLGRGWAVSFLTPKTWQRIHGITKADKALSCATAALLYPEHRNEFYGPRGGLRDGLAEAALIGAAFNQQIIDQGDAA